MINNNKNFKEKRGQYCLFYLNVTYFALAPIWLSEASHPAFIIIIILQLSLNFHTQGKWLTH